MSDLEPVTEMTPAPPRPPAESRVLSPTSSGILGGPSGPTWLCRLTAALLPQAGGASGPGREAVTSVVPTMASLCLAKQGYSGPQPSALPFMLYAGCFPANICGHRARANSLGSWAGHPTGLLICKMPSEVGAFLFLSFKGWGWPKEPSFTKR